MPTPRTQDSVILSPPPDDTVTYTNIYSHPSCPTDDASRPHTPPEDDPTSARDTPIAAQPPTPPSEDSGASDSDIANARESRRKTMPSHDDGPTENSTHSPRPLPGAIEVDPSDSDHNRQTAFHSPAANSHPVPLPTRTISAWRQTRFLPNSTSSYLRPGSQFKGTQQSDRQVYEVQVDIKHVDMNESYLCGYLRIKGLTDDHPTLTTFFEGEVIGTKYTFQTRHAEWGSNDKVDMQHWARFPAWRPLSKQAKRPDFSYRNFAQRENIFMRWKEQFLVPDHRVRNINGASFEGFYYICFNQINGHISGIYFHARSEKYQQLELNHVEDHGCLGAIEFR